MMHMLLSLQSFAQSLLQAVRESRVLSETNGFETRPSISWELSSRNTIWDSVRPAPNSDVKLGKYSFVPNSRRCWCESAATFAAFRAPCISSGSGTQDLERGVWSKERRSRSSQVSVRGPLKRGHLSNRDTSSGPNSTEACTYNTL